jgi:Phytanoyl-CoA dioxygenase (PhyH)
LGKRGEPNMTTDGLGGRIRVAANLYFPVIASPTFVLRKLAYARRIRHSSLDGPAPEVLDYVSALRRDGMVMIPNFFDPGTVAAMRQAIPSEADFEESKEGERSFFYRHAGEVAALAPFFEHPILAQTARAFISAEAAQLRKEVCLKVVHGDILSFEQFPHMDTWKLRMKAFLYLEDVTTENGPTVYYQGSHRGLWRLPMEARIAGWYRTGPQGFSVPEDLYLGCFWPHEVQRLTEAHGYRKTVCTGAAGTLLIFNGRGLHHATPLNSGRRLTLNSYWIHQGEHT